MGKYGRMKIFGINKILKIMGSFYDLIRFFYDF